MFIIFLKNVLLSGEWKDSQSVEEGLRSNLIQVPYSSLKRS
jgi:hypothetical protein